VACRQPEKTVEMTGKEWVRAYQKRTGALLNHHLECPVKVVFGGSSQDDDLLSHRASCCLSIARHSLRFRAVRVEKHGDDRGRGYYLTQ
jgi:hypothetical protein